MRRVERTDYNIGTGICCLRRPADNRSVRTTASLQAGTPLLKVTNASDVTLRGCGWFEKGDGTNYTNAASDVWLATVGTVSIENNYCTLAQSNCFLIAGANDVKFIGNTCDHFWYACLAASGTGTVASPVVLNQLTVTGNTCSHGPYCALPTIFVRDVAITGNVAYHSAYAVVQHVTHVTVNDNVADGAPDYGLSTGVTADCIFLEGISQFTVASNHLYNCGGRGIFALGSSLTVGTTEQLAMLQGNIIGNQIDSVATQFFNFRAGGFTRRVCRGIADFRQRQHDYQQLARDYRDFFESSGYYRELRRQPAGGRRRDRRRDGLQVYRQQTT